MASSDKNLPAPPYKTQLLASNGMLTEPWSKWIRQLFQRVGGFSALSNSELENASVSQAEIDALEVIVNSNFNTLNSKIQDIQQGRQV